MLTLNLAHKESSDYDYELINYPDGQKDIIIKHGFDIRADVQIKSRFNSFNDLGLITCAVKALRHLGTQNVHLYIPYILGARSDRRFNEGGTNYMKEIIAPAINALGCKSVTVLDPHSDVVEAVIEGFVKEDNLALVNFALNHIKERVKIIFISPDAGAEKKIFPVAKAMRINEVITASKHRDIATGKITSTKVPLLDGHIGNDFVIIDDICDGGRTFIEIAKVIESRFPDAKVYLVVTHGIFSAGFGELQEHFETIYATNSVRDIVDYGIPGQLIKQLNIF